MSTKQDHKRWRKIFNEECLKRDHNRCVFCDRTEDLDVYHITDRHEMANGGYVINNGITVCPEHHLLCEDFHITGICLLGYSPEELYKLIGSSYTEAYNDCLILK